MSKWMPQKLKLRFALSIVHMISRKIRALRNRSYHLPELPDIKTKLVGRYIWREKWKQQQQHKKRSWKHVSAIENAHLEVTIFSFFPSIMRLEGVLLCTYTKDNNVCKTATLNRGLMMLKTTTRSMYNAQWYYGLLCQSTIKPLLTFLLGKILPFINKVVLHQLCVRFVWVVMFNF